MYFDVNLLTALCKKILQNSIFNFSPVKVQLSPPFFRVDLANCQNINMFAVYYLTVRKITKLYLLPNQLLNSWAG
jgi:hypothetical protein